MLPQIHCFYEVLSETAQHPGLIVRQPRCRGQGIRFASGVTRRRSSVFARPRSQASRRGRSDPARALRADPGGYEIRYFSDLFRYAAVHEHGGLWMIPTSTCSSVAVMRRALLQHCNGVAVTPDISSAAMSCTRSLARAISSPCTGWRWKGSSRHPGSWRCRTEAPVRLHRLRCRRRTARWVFSPVLFNSIDWTETELFKRLPSQLSDYLDDDRVFGIHLWNRGPSRCR